MHRPMSNDPERTKTDVDRVEHFADADGTQVVSLEVDDQPWLAGTVTTAVQVQALSDELSPAEALDRGALGLGQHGGSEQHERDPDEIRDE